MRSQNRKCQSTNKCGPDLAERKLTSNVCRGHQCGCSDIQPFNLERLRNQNFLFRRWGWRVELTKSCDISICPLGSLHPASRQEKKKKEDGESHIRNYYGQHVQGLSADDRQCAGGLRAQNRLWLDGLRSESQLSAIGKAKK